MRGRRQLLLGIIIGYVVCSLLGPLSEVIGKAVDVATIVDIVLLAACLEDSNDGK